MQIEIHKIDNRIGSLDPLLLRQHRTIVLEAEDLYPGIDIWYDRKAKPELEKGERIGYLVQKDGRPLGAAIARQGTDAKICTVRVCDEAIHASIGKILFLLVAMNLRGGTKRVHFTAPQNLWNKYEDFFKSMGFTNLGCASEQYRLWDNEIIAAAEYISFKNFVFKNYLPLYARQLARINGENIDMILSLKPQYAERVLNKTKRMELRRKFSKKWIGSNVLIYSSSPVRAIVAKVKIKSVIKDTPFSMWLKWSEDIDCDLKEYEHYTKNASEIYGIILDEIEGMDPIPLTQLNHLLSAELVPPQSYCDINNNLTWRSAVGITNLLQKQI